MYFKFKETDIFRNTIVTYPRFECVYKSTGGVFKYFLVNNPQTTGTMKSIPSNGISVLEKNVDRSGDQMIRPFIPKNDSDSWISGISSGVFQSSYIYGQSLIGNYLIHKTIAKDYITSTDHPIVKAIRYAWDKYSLLSSEFDYDSFPIPCCYHVLPRELFGSGIKKGSVTAGLIIFDYVTGYSGYAVAQDINKDGVLRLTADSLVTSSLVGQKVGYVLYDEGMFIFQSASIKVQYGHDVVIPQHFTIPLWRSGTGGQDYNWNTFGDFNAIVDTTEDPFINFQGIRKVNNITMMCTAPSGKLNSSNNPTFVEKDQDIFLTQSSDSTFVENTKLYIKNIVSSSFNVTENFEKQTYISEIYIYDEDKKLIAIGKLANPVRKREIEDFTFKLSYDL